MVPGCCFVMSCLFSLCHAIFAARHYPQWLAPCDFLVSEALNQSRQCGAVLQPGCQNLRDVLQLFWQQKNSTSRGEAKKLGRRCPSDQLQIRAYHRQAAQLRRAASIVGIGTRPQERCDALVEGLSALCVVRFIQLMHNKRKWRRTSSVGTVRVNRVFE